MFDEQQAALGPSRLNWNIVHRVVGRNLTLPVQSLASFLAFPSNLPDGSKSPWDI